MAATDVLAAGGILRAGEVVELAAAAKLDLACAAVMLVKESAGGRNVWGSDGVPTGGTYVKGAVVTREAYLAYRARRTELGSQGVGPAQLTWSGYQDQADALGGCWDWRCNVRVGFAALAQLQRQHGIRDGFRRYNGSGPMAERYADDAMAKLATWRSRLGTPALPSTPAPVPRKDDELSAEAERLIREMHTELTQRHPNRVDYRFVGEPEPAVRLGDTMAGMAVNADARAFEARQVAEQARDHAYTGRTELAELRTELLEKVDELRQIVMLGREAMSPAAGGIDLDALADRIIERYVERLA